MAEGRRIQLPPSKDVEAIISGDALLSARTTVQWGEKVGTALSRSLKAAQIRNIFGKVRQLERGWMFNQQNNMNVSQREMILLIPKLKYQSARKPEVEDLAAVLIEAITMVDDPKYPGETREKFQRFVDFFEAILAYHKAAGGN